MGDEEEGQMGAPCRTHVRKGEVEAGAEASAANLPPPRSPPLPPCQVSGLLLVLAKMVLMDAGQLVNVLATKTVIMSGEGSSLGGGVSVDKVREEEEEEEGKGQ